MALQISDNFALSGCSKGILGVSVKIPRPNSRDGQPGMVKNVEYPVLIDSLLQVTSFSLIQGTKEAVWLWHVLSELVLVVPRGAF